MSVVGASNITNTQVHARQNQTQKWVTDADPALVWMGSITVDKIMTALKNHRGVFIGSSTLILPSTADLLETFATVVNRPLVDGDVFYINVSGYGVWSDITVTGGTGTTINPPVVNKCGKLVFVVNATNSSIKLWLGPNA